MCPPFWLIPTKTRKGVPDWPFPVTALLAGDPYWTTADLPRKQWTTVVLSKDIVLKDDYIMRLRSFLSKLFIQ